MSRILIVISEQQWWERAFNQSATRTPSPAVIFYDSDSDSEENEKEKEKQDSKHEDKETPKVVRPQLPAAAIRYNIGAPCFVKSSSATLEEETKEMKNEEYFLFFSFLSFFFFFLSFCKLFYYIICTPHN